MRLARGLATELAERSAACTIQPTAAGGDAERIAGQLLDEDRGNGDRPLCLVPCGGDGTIQEVVNAMMSRPQHPALLGLAPGGRCNDFVSSFGVPPDPQVAAEVLHSGITREVDLGRINQRYFCSIAAMGFDAAVSRYVNDLHLPVKGATAYVLGTLRLLLSYRGLGVRLRTDQADTHEDVFLVASANTRSYGGCMTIAPHADLDDGLLELCIVSTISRLRGLRLLQAVMRGAHERMPEVRFVKTRQVTIETDDAQEVWADGEFVCRTPVTIAAIPRALRLIVPAG